MSTRLSTRLSLRELVVTSRPLFWINTAHPFALAFALAGGLRLAEGPNIGWLVFAAGLAYYLFPYNLLMYGINDVYDYESDLRNPRKGGAQGAIAAPAQHRRILIACAVVVIPSTLVMLALGGPLAGAVLLFALFTVVGYSLKGFRFKEKPVLDSLTASAHVVLPPLHGMLLAASWNADGSFGSLGGAAALAAFFIWGVASHMFTAAQDVIPDREGGTPSVATVFGARRSVRAAVVGYVLAGLVAGVGIGVWSGSWLLGAGAGALVLPHVINTGRYWMVDDETSAVTTQGYRRFIVINSVLGAIVTMTAIAFAVFGR